MAQNKANRYDQVIEHVFLRHFTDGVRSVRFERHELIQAGNELGIELPKNLGDVIYTYRFRQQLPASIRALAPNGETWIIRLVGTAQYEFFATSQPFVLAQDFLEKIKIPDSTPGLISKYALSDEQALLAKLRYNRMLDIFTGITCFSMQSHLRTSVKEIGQTEIDEIYVGIDRSGANYILPVQAKGGKDKLSVVQIEQNIAVCRSRFPNMICRPIAAQFIDLRTIALFEFGLDGDGLVVKTDERHFTLVAPSEITDDELRKYCERLESDPPQ